MSEETLKDRLERQLAEVFPASRDADPKILTERERKEIESLCVTDAEKERFANTTEATRRLIQIMEDKIAAGSPRSLWADSIKNRKVDEATELRMFKKELEFRAEREALGLPRVLPRAPRH